MHIEESTRSQVYTDIVMPSYNCVYTPGTVIRSNSSCIAAILVHYQNCDTTDAIPTTVFILQEQLYTCDSCMYSLHLVLTFTYGLMSVRISVKQPSHE